MKGGEIKTMVKTKLKGQPNKLTLYIELEDKMKKSQPTQNDLTPRKKAQHIQPSDKVYTLFQARKLGTILYWNGKTCQNNHNSVRYTRDGVCKECYQDKIKRGSTAQMDREKIGGNGVFKNQFDSNSKPIFG